MMPIKKEIDYSSVLGKIAKSLGWLNWWLFGIFVALYFILIAVGRG